MITPTLLTDYLQEVLACACTILENGLCDSDPSRCGCPCRMFISAGPPAWDLEACCSDGQLTAHITNIYPFGNFPAQNSGVSLCQIPLAADITITLLRCWPAVLKDDGSSPNHIEQNQAAVDLHRDWYLLTTGLLCCLKTKNRAQKFVFRGSNILPPNGGCAGVEFKFTVEMFDPIPT